MFKVKKYKSIKEREDKTTKWWKENKIFEKSVESRPKDDQYSFLDGPPFVTGLPHYGQLLGRTAKDVIPRYQTMKGKRVRRVWGWDCHGLPVEEKVERQEGIKNRRAIEKYGKDKFLKACKTYVDNTSSEWEWYVDKIAEWIDFKGAYKTMDTDYMESVIWAFKQLYDKELIYEGEKTLLFCTRCGTPVSKFEIAMDDSYADMQDPAVFVEFIVTTEGEFENARLVAWTTTPWTLPSNRALVVDPQEGYCEFKGREEGKTYIAAEKRLDEFMQEDEFEIIRCFKGKDLIGLEYKPPFEYFPPNKKDFKVYKYEGMVHMDEGTGIVHSAPGFGEIDTIMGQEIGLTIMFSVDDEGKFIDKVEDYKGMYVKKADEKIIEDLEEADLLFKHEIITHRYPYCYRCETPLIHKALKGWFIDIQKLKPLLLKNAEKINWMPEHLHKRFVNNIKDAPDWNISRSRYWATVMPVWKCDKCEKYEVFGSIKEIEDRSGQEVKSLHRDGVDHIKFDCKNCKGEMSRIPEVLDVWVESGSMPFGQIHYPFENDELFEKTFPADYIVEYVAQIRAWFYCMHVMSNALIGENSFKNVVATGTMAGTDGRKMSKSYGNYPDPKETLEKYGGDSLRLYLMSSPLMLAEDSNMDEKEWKAQISTVIFPLWNSCRYFATYANIASWEPKSDKEPKSSSKLDGWIIAKLKEFKQTVEENLDNYNLPFATRPISDFVSDISTWYIRRSRDRFVDGDKDALATLYYVLVQTSKVIAPIAPFIAEEMYQSLAVGHLDEACESVHLCYWPKMDKVSDGEKKLIEDMEKVRKLASLGQAARVESKMKVRQPLQTLKVEGEGLDEWMKDLLKEELNVKEVELVDEIKDEKGWEVQKEKAFKVSLDTNLNKKLKREGLLRELVRTIQSQRKKGGFDQEDVVELTLETEDKDIKEVVEEMKDELLEQTNSKSVEFGEGEKEFEVNGKEVGLTITKG